MGRVTHENLEELFTSHALTAEQVAQYEKVRYAMIDVSRVVLDHVPECADRSAALRKIREARMDANAAIALNGMI